MKKIMISGLACAVVAFALPEPVHAHGGQYRGPGDVVPPNPGGGGRAPGPRAPGTPGPAGPSGPSGSGGAVTPGPQGPTSSGPAASSPTAGPTTGGRGGAQITPDLNRWQFWWEFNKDPFINLKEAIHAATAVTGSDDFFMGGTRKVESTNTMKPTETEIVERILPALKRALDSTDDRDIVSSCMVAMAKIGKNHSTFKILDEFKKRLPENDQEISETAALAMGISQMPEAIEDLIAIASDNPKGRELVKQGSVNDRTRSFACYGLGLIANATGDADNKRKCFEALKEVLETTTKSMVERNVPVAAVNGIRLIKPNPEGGDKDKQLLADCLDTLWSFYERKEGQTEQQVQAHVPPAIAQLLGRGGDTDGRYKKRFADLLSGKLGKFQNGMYQSAVIALGNLCQPEEIEKGDKVYSDALLNYYREGKNEQARYFSLMALAKIGGDRNRNELLKALARGSKALEKPWAAISLGVLAFNEAEAAGEGAPPDTAIGDALLHEIDRLKNAETQSAMAVALGLCKYRQAADKLEEMLRANKHRDEFAGYLCIGLALMNSTQSMVLINDIVETSIRRPDLLKQAAIALGKMGDKEVTSTLEQMLKDDSSARTVAKLSAVASALGFIGDSRTIAPLITMLHDESITELSRAFAAVALGGVADKEPLPWNSKIGVDMNYRAAVETLTDGSGGILDIL